MQIYVFDAESREFLRSEEAFPDPLESRAQGREVWLLPDHACFTPPPAPKAGHAALWNGAAWEQVEDHRPQSGPGGLPLEGTGTPFWMPGDTWQTPARYMAAPGPLPEGALTDAPAKPAAPKAPQAENYKVQSGDSVWAITHRFGMSEAEFRKLNPSVDSSSMRVGDTVKIIRKK